LSIDVVALATTTPLKPGIVPDNVLDLFRFHPVSGQVFHVVFIPDDVFNIHNLAPLDS
jgi:hypothetical protein